MNIQKLIESAGNITDPRRQWGYLRHKLVSILVISLCATIGGAEDFDEFEIYGNQHKQWLERFLELPYGIPDKDTFRRVLEVLDPNEVSECLYNWLSENRSCDGKIIPIDGKTIRGSGNAEHNAYHIVSAWIAENQITLGEIVVDDKSNEITAIPKLLDMVDIEGATVTIDAMGCQKSIAEKIIDRGADYVIGLKGNQEKLHNFAISQFENMPPEAEFMTNEKGHGREEKREYFLNTDVDLFSESVSWCGFNAIGAVRSTVLEKGEIRTETRYFITSLTCVEKFANAVRKHWSIENQLHWHLDVSFGEDDSRARKDNSPLNLNVLRKTALPLIRNTDVGKKMSVKHKMFVASMDSNVMEKILFQK